MPQQYFQYQMCSVFWRDPAEIRRLTPTRRQLFSQTVEILVFNLSAQSGIGRVLGALALRAMDSDGVFGSRNV